MQQKLVNLWFVILIGFVVHALLGLMPLFFGASISHEGMGESQLSVANWMSVVFYIIPMTMVFVHQLNQANWFRYTNGVFSVLFLVMNLVHPMELFEEDPFAWHQLVLMIFIVIVNIVLCRQSWVWLKATSK